MIEEILPNLFGIQIPLPDSPLKYLNSYVIKDKTRSLLIDTGFNHPACYDAMTNGLKKIGIKLENTDIFITHFHSDHFSLVPRLKTETSKVFFNRPEKELLENWEGFDAMLENAKLHGFPSPKLQAALKAHPGSRFGVEWSPDIVPLSEGQSMDYGEYHFTCVSTPGHTLGHLCLYEPQKKVLVSGDHVLIDITPNIQCWSDQDNPLLDYLNSLEKISRLDVDLVLPGHRRKFTDLNGRVKELVSHHRARLDEILTILEPEPKTAFQTAALMHWDIKADTWEDFPIAQQWFATGEALSHLRYLEAEKKIKRMIINETIYFKITNV